MNFPLGEEVRCLMQRVPLDRLIVSHNQEDQRIHPYYDGMVTEEHGLPLDVYYEIIWKNGSASVTGTGMKNPDPACHPRGYGCHADGPEI